MFISDPITNFYSRASARRDVLRLCCPLYYENFYSRASARRDDRTRSHGNVDAISTHAPLRGATSRKPGIARQYYDFYSRASARRDLVVGTNADLVGHFYSRASARRGRMAFQIQKMYENFYSRASARRDLSMA